MSAKVLPPERFNPCPESTGVELFELWEVCADGSQFLVAIAGTASDWRVRPGDTIVRRRWAPASEPTLYNSARAES